MTSILIAAAVILTSLWGVAALRLVVTTCTHNRRVRAERYARRCS